MSGRSACLHYFSLRVDCSPASAPLGGRTLGSVGRGVLGAVGLPLAGALQLVAAASDGTAATVGVSRRARPRRRARSPGFACAAPLNLNKTSIIFCQCLHGQAFEAGTLQRHVVVAGYSGLSPPVAQAKEVCGKFK